MLGDDNRDDIVKIERIKPYYPYSKDSEDLDKTLFNKAKKNKRVKTDEEAKQIAVDSRKLMDEYSKIKYKT